MDYHNREALRPISKLVRLFCTIFVALFAFELTLDFCDAVDRSLETVSHGGGFFALILKTLFVIFWFFAFGDILILIASTSIAGYGAWKLAGTVLKRWERNFRSISIQQQQFISCTAILGIGLSCFVLLDAPFSYVAAIASAASAIFVAPWPAGANRVHAAIYGGAVAGLICLALPSDSLKDLDDALENGSSDRVSFIVPIDQPRFLHAFYREDEPVQLVEARIGGFVRQGLRFGVSPVRAVARTAGNAVKRALPFSTGAAAAHAEASRPSPKVNDLKWRQTKDAIREEIKPRLLIERAGSPNLPHRVTLKGDDKTRVVLRQGRDGPTIEEVNTSRLRKGAGTVMTVEAIRAAGLSNGKQIRLQNVSEPRTVRQLKSGISPEETKLGRYGKNVAEELGKKVKSVKIEAQRSEHGNLTGRTDMVIIAE